MTTSGFSLFDRIFADLQAQGPLKTWSLIVTIFGDMAPTRDTSIDSQTLGRLCAPFGVRPEALRVALHRLRKDGWIEAERKGRRSSYRLTQGGETATRAAAVRIYAPAQAQGSDWCILPVETSVAPEPDALAIGPHLLVRPSGSNDPALSISCAAGDAPQWMRRALAMAGSSQDFAAYAPVLKALVSALGETQPEMAECVALRLAVLHYWRRILLRSSEAAEALLGADWSGYEARKLTYAAFDLLGRPDLSQLAEGEAA